MKPALARRLAAAAEQRNIDGLIRSRPVVDPVGPDRQVSSAGRTLIDFCSNDYLGLASQNPEPSIGRFGAAASPLISGYHPSHQALEAALAEFTGFEAACLFSSGYQANLAVGQALIERGRPALADRLNHASLNDGLRLGGARIVRYAHADPEDAEARLKPDTGWIVSDTVFSMDGDLAPLADLAWLSERHGIPLWIDDAHGLGVLGQTGRGTLEQLGLASAQVDVLVGTFGKALGTAGAFVAGDRALVEHLENSARGLIYSTAPPPIIAEQTLANLHRVRDEHWRRERLFEHIDRFRDHCRQAGITLLPSSTPIQIVTVGDNARAVALAEALCDAGFLVRAIRPPTVPDGTARLRITLSSAHRPQDIVNLCACLGRLQSSP